MPVSKQEKIYKLIDIVCDNIKINKSKNEVENYQRIKKQVKKIVDGCRLNEEEECYIVNKISDKLCKIYGR